jgi:hypothetical protein
MEKHTTDTIIDISRKVYEEQEKEFALTTERIKYNCDSDTVGDENMLLDNSDRYFAKRNNWGYKNMKATDD